MAVLLRPGIHVPDVMCNLPSGSPDIMVPVDSWVGASILTGVGAPNLSVSLT